MKTYSKKEVFRDLRHKPEDDRWIFWSGRLELNKSKSYYSNIDPDLGNHFLDDIENALYDIEHHPKASAVHEDNPHLRLKTTKRFPFIIIYHPDFEADIVYIVAIAHQKRKPDYWKDRFW
jgi:toxin ParE1/3/4